MLRHFGDSAGQSRRRRQEPGKRAQVLKTSFTLRAARKTRFGRSGWVSPAPERQPEIPGQIAQILNKQKQDQRSANNSNNSSISVLETFEYKIRIRFLQTFRRWALKRMTSRNQAVSAEVMPDLDGLDLILVMMRHHSNRWRRESHSSFGGYESFMEVLEIP